MTTTTTSELVPGYRDVTRLTVASFLARSLADLDVAGASCAPRDLAGHAQRGRLLMASQPRVGPGRQSGGSSNTRAISRAVLAW